MFATIYVPTFFLQAAVRHEPELRSKAIALIDDGTAKATIVELNHVAEKAGVRCGMAPSQGLARCSALIIKTRDRAQEQLLADTMLQLAFTLSPDVEATSSGIWTVRFTDNRDLEGKTEHVISAAGALQIAARAGIALTADASLIAAHIAEPLLRIDHVKNFLAALPIEALAAV